MSTVERYQVANPNIIHDTIEDQVILLNLETGRTTNSPRMALLFGMLLSRAPLSLLLPRSSNPSHPAASVAIDRDVAKFVQDLLEEELLAPLTSENAAPARLRHLYFPRMGMVHLLLRPY